MLKNVNLLQKMSKELKKNPLALQIYKTDFTIHDRARLLESKKRDQYIWLVTDTSTHMINLRNEEEYGILEYYMKYRPEILLLYRIHVTNIRKDLAYGYIWKIDEIDVKMLLQKTA